MKLSSANSKIVAIEGGQLIAGTRVAVAPGHLATAAPALLTVRPGETGEESILVTVLPRAEMTEHCIAIPSALAEDLGLDDVAQTPWVIDSDSFSRSALRELSLELTVEQSLDDVVGRLNRSDSIGELALYVQPNQDLTSVTVEIDDLSFRVLKSDPAPSASRASVLEVDENTRIQVFAPGAKSGADIVILADCSGSMDVADLTDTQEKTGTGGLLQSFLSSTPPALQRDEAQRRALRRLLDLRLTMAGRVSRIALVAFNDRCLQRFPRGGGMEELDGTSSPVLVQEFRDAIGLLRAENAGTDIGQALHFAAELLCRHGHHANDRLIVLVSDGANWAPKGEDATGEETIAFKEPVSLMSHLHRDLKINLHAIGIGTEATFRKWYSAQPGTRGSEPPIGLIPNHTLLEELVRVGGGDPSRTGDTDVLESYFSGLGLGVTRRLRPAKRQPLPEPNAIDIAKLSSRVSGTDNASLAAIHGRVDEIVEEIWDLYDACNGYSVKECDRPVFRPTAKSFKSLTKGIKKKVKTGDEFQNFVLAVHQVFFEARDEDMKSGKEGGIKACLNDDRLLDLNAIRVSFAHDLQLGRKLDKKTNNLHRSGEAMRRLVGTRHVEEADVVGWASLQEAILRDIRDVLSDVRAIYRDSNRIPVSKQNPPAEFVWRS